jgi:NAD(P)-dependent dehydrogenase (short-subunit alcohol dehydrogenase family)
MNESGDLARGEVTRSSVAAVWPRQLIGRSLGEFGSADGLPRFAPKREARLRLGNPVTMRERTLEASAALRLDGMGRDLRHALRQLRRSPGFAVTTILTLALGIGATTAIFTLVQQVMLQSLPVAKPEDLIRIGDSADCCYSNGYSQVSDSTQNDWNLFSWEAWKLFRTETPAFEDLAAFQIGEGNAELALRRAGSATPAETGNGEYVSGNFFRTFGISAWRGRLLTDADDEEGAPPVAVMSFRAWQEKVGSDASVLGAVYEVNGHAFTIRDEAFCRQLVDQAVSGLGGLDILVSNAGRQHAVDSISDMTTELFDWTMKTNIYAPFWIIKAALPHLPAGAAIIATTSVEATDPSADLYDYAQTKAATMNYVKCLAKQLAKKGIRVNGVAPGPIWTPLQVSGGATEKKIESFGGKTPLGRPGQPVELAPIYVELARDDASYSTGQIYGASGGTGQPF